MGSEMASPVSSVTLNAVSHSYGRANVALCDVTINWPQGFVALLGPNGAGKSTLLGLIVGDLRMQTGRMKMAKGSIGVVPQQVDWPGRFTVREFLTYAAWLQGVPRALWRARLGTAVSAVSLEGLADTRLGDLSGGQHRRAMIAQALVNDPAVLVLDEPSAGLDPRQRIQLRTLLRQLADVCSVIVATHLVEDVESVADWLTILDAGRVMHDGPMSEVHARWGAPGHSAVEAAYLDLVRG